VRDSGHEGVYNSGMSLIEQIQQDIIAAMKAREEQRLSTLRMVKSALKNREIEKMAPLEEKESQAVLTTQGIGGAIHQRRTPGNGRQRSRRDRPD